MTSTKVNVREFITETIDYHKAAGLNEAEAMARCMVELRKRKKDLIDDFFEQFIDTAVRNTWANKVSRDRREIGEAVERRQGGRGSTDSRVPNAPAASGEEEGDRGRGLHDAHPVVAPTPTSPPAEGGDHRSGDTQSSTVSREPEGSDHNTFASQSAGVAPTPGQVYREEMRRMTREAVQQQEHLSILDYPFFVPGLGRLPLREMTLKHVRTAAKYHWTFARSHYEIQQFLLELAGDQHGKAGDGEDETNILEYRSEKEIEALFIKHGRPVPPSEDSIDSEAEA